MDPRIEAAVIDNARWCDLVCATHGIAGRFDEDAWVSPRRTPPMYPDAVTLRDDGAVASLLARVDRTAGCSIKDSFATLDLTDAGFRVLFDASWISRPAGSAPDGGRLAWEPVGEPGALRSWALAHGGGATFAPALLDEPSVTILAGRERDGRLVAGAVATEGDAAIGISNVFAVHPAAGDIGSSETDAFVSATAAIVRRFPGRTVVGYLSADRLAASRDAGFEAIGPLRIWLRDGP